MKESWTELWSFGAGGSRTYCGIARTEEGFAVDVFVGDTCIEGHECTNAAAAGHVATALKDRYRRVAPAQRARMTSIDFVLPPSSIDRHVARAV